MKSLTKDDVEEKNTKKTWQNSVRCPHVASLILIALVVISLMHNNFFGLDNQFLDLNLKQDQIANKNGPIPGCNLFSDFLLVKNLEERISNIGIGDGNLITVTFPGYIYTPSV
ncbi:hypothetical protein ACS0TY_011920 [Phlomoides rotata]